jgi:hypothetical protein
MLNTHLIRFPNQKEDQRGLMILLEAGGEVLGLPNREMVVTSEQIKALEQAKVRFEYLSKTAPDGTHPTSV